jgi:hypothetical protein
VTDAGNAAYEAAIRAARLNGAGLNGGAGGIDTGGIDTGGIDTRAVGIGSTAGDARADTTTPAPQIRLRLEIVTGAHHGAVVTLEPGEYRIGSSPDADIVLSDDGVVAEHAAVHVGPDGVRVDAIGADVSVGDEPLPHSRGCRLRLPANFSVGAARIELVDLTERNAAQRTGLTLKSSALLAAAVACVGVIIVITTITARQFSSRVTAGPAQSQAAAARTPAPREPVIVATAAPAAAGVAVPPSAAPSTGAVEEALAALRGRLAAADIKSIDITAEDGRLVARGTLSGHETADWPAIQQWFDKTYGSTILLSARIMPGAVPNLPSLQIQAVWYGERPYVMLADGEHYFKGAVLDNGWSIRDILADRLVLAKDGNTVTLTYH